VLTTGHLLELGSITKVYTAVLLADAVERGEVALDDPVAAHLGLSAPLRPALERVTLASLATHTSGLPRLPPGLVRYALRHGDDPYGALDDERLVEAFRRARVRRAGRFRYSNLGPALLGLALARRAGSASYGELLRERVCAPLDLSATWAWAPDGAARADGHDRRGRRVSPWRLDGIAGAGAVVATVGDLLGFLVANAEPPPSALGRALRATHAPRTRRGGIEIGLGWLRARGRRDRPDVLWHSGGTGGFRSFAALAPGRPAAVAVVANSRHGVDRLGQKLLQELLEAAPAPP
jgi:CubicO group peptidase (beta-lactamase class C family)